MYNRRIVPEDKGFGMKYLSNQRNTSLERIRSPYLNAWLTGLVTA